MKKKKREKRISAKTAVTLMGKLSDALNEWWGAVRVQHCAS